MGNLFISAYGRSNVGKKRANNEDNFFISGVTVDSAIDITSVAKESNEAAFAVFDGMGGEAAGEKASQAAAVTYGQRMTSMLDGDFSPAVMQDTIEAANKKVCDEIRVIGKRMGCTFASVGFKNDTIYVSNVGDSRVYLLRGNAIHCVSKDHTVAQTMVEAGLVSYENSQHSKEKHQLTQHIGIFPEEMIIEPFYNTIKADIGDIVLVCSDGLTDMLSDADIGAILASGGTEEEMTNALVNQALQNGGKDNVTVIVAKVSGENAVPVAVKKNNKKMIAVIGSVAAVIVLALILVFLLKGKDNADDNKDNGGGSKNPTVSVQTTEGNETTEEVTSDDSLSKIEENEDNENAESDNDDTEKDEDVTDDDAEDDRNDSQGSPSGGENEGGSKFPSFEIFGID